MNSYTQNKSLDRRIIAFGSTSEAWISKEKWFSSEAFSRLRLPDSINELPSFCIAVLKLEVGSIVKVLIELKTNKKTFFEDVRIVISAEVQQVKLASFALTWASAEIFWSLLKAFATAWTKEKRSKKM